MLDQRLLALSGGSAVTTSLGLGFKSHPALDFSGLGCTAIAISSWQARQAGWKLSSYHITISAGIAMSYIEVCSSERASLFVSSDTDSKHGFFKRHASWYPTGEYCFRQSSCIISFIPSTAKPANGGGRRPYLGGGCLLLVKT
jgi:hypothetical protein